MGRMYRELEMWPYVSQANEIYRAARIVGLRDGQHVSWGNEIGNLYLGVTRCGSMHRGVISWAAFSMGQRDGVACIAR